jgi:Ca2+-binding RTX toxin-like protein
VGDGHNTILAGAGGDTVDLGAGSDTVTLSGWSNLLIGGLGLASVSGGTNNVFRIEGVGSTGGLDVMDFGTTHNDVLDLSKVLSGITLTPGNIDGYVSVTGAGTDTVVSVDANGMGSFSGHVVATLHGAGASSLADLQAQSAIKLS